MKDPLATHSHDDHFHDDIIYPAAIPFVLVHLSAFAAIWTGVTVQALLLCVALYGIRMFGLTAVYHRYFSHRSYKTSRVMQFLLAFFAQSSAQRGVLWWAAIHRHHHKHSDTELDVHSPKHRGFFYSHVGWVFDKRNDDANYDLIPDMTKFPELRWLNRHPYLPAALLAVGCFLWMGWVGLVVGFIWSTVLLYHGTFSINSLAHVHGSQRYVTGDDSRNNWWLALITLGEGWHNNHHAYQSATRQGFRWWEIDLTYYALKVMSWLGLVWDLRDPPEEVVKNEHKLGRRVVEQVAHQIAASFPVERIAAQVRETLAQTPDFDEIVRTARTARDRAQERLASVHLPELPHLPSADELRARAREKWDQAPELHMQTVVDRAHELLLLAVSARVLQGLMEASGAA